MHKTRGKHWDNELLDSYINLSIVFLSTTELNNSVEDMGYDGAVRFKIGYFSPLIWYFFPSVFFPEMWHYLLKYELGLLINNQKNTF